MMKVLSIGLLLVATDAGASVRSFKPDDTATLRPVSLTQQHEAVTALKRSCKPVMLFLRLPDGRFMLVGAVKPDDC